MENDSAPPSPHWDEVAAHLASRLSRAILAIDLVPPDQAPETATTLVDQAFRAANRNLQGGESLSEESKASAWGAIRSLIEFLEHPSASAEECPFDSADLRGLCANFAQRDENFDFDEWSFDLIDLAVGECSLEFQPRHHCDLTETGVPSVALRVADDPFNDLDVLDPQKWRSPEARKWEQAKVSWLALGDALRRQGIDSGVSMEEEDQAAEKAFKFACSMARKPFGRDRIEVLQQALFLLLNRLKEFDPNRPGSSFEQFLMDRVKHVMQEARDDRSSTDRENQKIIEAFYQSRKQPVPDDPAEVYADFSKEFRQRHDRYHADEMDLRDHGFLGENAIQYYFSRRQLRNSSSFEEQMGDDSGLLAPCDTINDASSEVDQTKDSLAVFSRLLVEAEKELLALFDSTDEKQRRDTQIFLAWWANDVPRLASLLNNAELPLPDSLRHDHGKPAPTQQELATRFGFKGNSAITKIVAKVSLQICAKLQAKHPRLTEDELRAAFPRAFAPKGHRKDPTSEFKRALAIMNRLMKTEPPEHLADQALLYRVHLPQAVLNQLHPNEKTTSLRLIDLVPGIQFPPSTIEVVVKQYNLDATIAIRRMKGIVRRVKCALKDANVSEAVWKALTKMPSTDIPGSGINPISAIE